MLLGYSELYMSVIRERYIEMDNLEEEVRRWFASRPTKTPTSELVSKLLRRVLELEQRERMSAEVAHSGDTIGYAPEGNKVKPKQFYCLRHGVVEEVIESCVPGAQGVWCERCRLESYDAFGISRVRELK